jgi:hypothetical protein
MPELVFYRPTWLDRSFKKALQKAPPRERERRERDLGDLLIALQGCFHPTLDPSLQRWRPTAYKGVARIEGFQFVEYRLPRLMRVVACYSEVENPDRIARIILLTATLTHDHERMKRLIRKHRGGLQEYSEEEPGA